MLQSVVGLVTIVPLIAEGWDSTGGMCWEGSLVSHQLTKAGMGAVAVLFQVLGGTRWVPNTSYNGNSNSANDVLQATDAKPAQSYSLGFIVIYWPLTLMQLQPPLCRHSP